MRVCLWVVQLEMPGRECRRSACISGRLLESRGRLTRASTTPSEPSPYTLHSTDKLWNRPMKHLTEPSNNQTPPADPQLSGRAGRWQRSISSPVCRHRPMTGPLYLKRVMCVGGVDEARRTPVRVCCRQAHLRDGTQVFAISRADRLALLVPQPLVTRRDETNPPWTWRRTPTPCDEQRQHPLLPPRLAETDCDSRTVGVTLEVSRSARPGQERNISTTRGGDSRDGIPRVISNVSGRQTAENIECLRHASRGETWQF